MAFSNVHLGDFRKANDIYDEIITNNSNYNPIYHLYKAICLYYLNDYELAKKEVLKGPKTLLQNRILMHISHKLNDEASLVNYHNNINEKDDEDQLSLASIHFSNGLYQQAAEIYKAILLEKRDFLALQVYIALCYYKLDYFEVSLDILDPYLQKFKDSAIAINLRACNQFKLYDGKTAENELKHIINILSSNSNNLENDLIQHNLVVFRQGLNALQILPSLIHYIPEAKLNLIIYYLKNNDINEANKLMQDIEPNNTTEYILKGIIHTWLGQLNQDNENLKLGQQFFQLVGDNESDRDTIPGRQCMASCFFLVKHFKDVLVYLESIKEFCAKDDNFNHNYGLALAKEGKYIEAEQALLKVTNEIYTAEYTYISWLTRCKIYNNKPREAWEIYLNMSSSNHNNAQSFSLLLLIANDCYKVGHFFYSAKAFHMISKIDESIDIWEGKRGACCGIFQKVIAGEMPNEYLANAIEILSDMKKTTPQSELMIKVMTNYAAENNITV